MVIFHSYVSLPQRVKQLVCLPADRSRVSTALANENSSFSQRPSPLKARSVDWSDGSKVDEVGYMVITYVFWRFTCMCIYIHRCTCVYTYIYKSLYICVYDLIVCIIYIYIYLFFFIYNMYLSQSDQPQFPKIGSREKQPGTSPSSPVAVRHGLANFAAGWGSRVLSCGARENTHGTEKQDHQMI